MATLVHLVAPWPHLQWLDRQKDKLRTRQCYQPSDKRAPASASASAKGNSGTGSRRRKSPSTTTRVLHSSPTSRRRTIPRASGRRITEDFVEPPSTICSRSRHGQTCWTTSDCHPRRTPAGVWGPTIPRNLRQVVNWRPQAPKTVSDVFDDHFRLRQATATRLRPSAPPRDPLHDGLSQKVRSRRPDAKSASHRFGNRAYCKVGSNSIGSSHFRHPQRPSDVTSASGTHQNPLTKIKKLSHFLSVWA